jgi:acetyltransferase-like isoleucine patch superfamily enzyme
MSRDTFSEDTGSKPEIHASVFVPSSSTVWGASQIRENAVIGKNCIIGRNVYIGPGVKIGNNCKIQNNALIYEPAVIEDGVFIGPGVILTNDKHPRAVNEDGSLKGKGDWSPQGVTIRRGASIGAGSVCIGPVEIGEFAMIGAGCVVTKSVPANETHVGNPAKKL